jgi:hypothetical protein
MQKQLICSTCNENIDNYNGIGRPKKYCDKCKDKKVVFLQPEKNITLNSIAEALEFAEKSIKELEKKNIKCIFCKKILKGQRRKFCSDNCRKKEFYHRYTKKEGIKSYPKHKLSKGFQELYDKNFPPTIEYHNKILRKNYNIIVDIFESNHKSTLQKVLKSTLVDKGYNFNYFTHYIKTEKKGFFFNKEIISTCIYEFTIELKNDFVFLIKRIEN